MNALPPDRASESEPMVDGLKDFEGFDAEVAAMLDGLGRQVRPHEFDPDTILRRTARRRAGRVLTASAAGIAVVVGATAFAAHAGAPAATVTHTTSAADGQAGTGTDPLVAPGYFRTSPNSGAANGFTELGGTTQVGLQNTSTSDNEFWSVTTDWTADGVELSARVEWFGDTPQTSPGGQPGSVVGEVDGHPAYYSKYLKNLTFWTGALGYATANIFTDSNGDLDQSVTSAELLSVADSLVPTAAPVPLPIRVTGLDSAQVTLADMGWLAGDSTGPWNAYLRLQIDGASYDVTAIPGQPVTPTPTGKEKTTGEVSATKTVDGLGITVSTSSGNSGSDPTAAQVLAHVTSLGVSPSGWTTSVLVK